jgi:hypothetical protein
MESVLQLFSLKGQTALVTGGTRGIGQAMTIALAEAGADILLVQVRWFVLLPSRAIPRFPSNTAIDREMSQTHPQRQQSKLSVAPARYTPATYQMPPRFQNW